jgi:hypothetical protein
METMSMKEAMVALGDVSRTHIYNLAKRGELHLIRNPAYRHGPVKIPVEDIARILARQA